MGIRYDFAWREGLNACMAGGIFRMAGRYGSAWREGLNAFMREELNALCVHGMRD